MKIQKAGTVAGSSKPMRDYMRGKIDSSEYFKATKVVGSTPKHGSKSIKNAA